MKFVAWCFIAQAAIAGDFTLAVVGTFGEKLSGCTVAAFRSSGNTGIDYRDRFSGMSAHDLPDGEYDLSAACREGRVTGKVKVDDFVRFGLIRQYGRTTRSDHMVPRLTIRMTGGIHDGETWWIALTSVYGKHSYDDQFQGNDATARIFDPDPGTYLVAVRSTKGYACVREIDLVETTHSWTFDARVCKFDVDEFAHVVTPADQASGKKSGWYRKIRAYNERMFRELENKADKR